VTEAVIVAAGRSAIGRAFKGSLRLVRPDDLLAQVVRGVLDSIELNPLCLEDMIVGCASPTGASGFNVARVGAVLAGLPHVPGVTVHRYCASSLQSVAMAAHAIRAGEGDAFIAAGVESVSSYTGGFADNPEAHNPRFAPAQARSTERALGAAQVWESNTPLPDVYIDMGQTAENVAAMAGISRLAMDEFAQRSQERAVLNQDNGFFAREIIPISTPGGQLVDHDDGPRRNSTLDALAALSPVFRPDGSVTAGNSCPLNDGAAAVVIMSDHLARDCGLAPLARIVSTGLSALDPEIMGLGPVEASQRALRRAGLTIGDMDTIEINEAFASQVLASARSLDVDQRKLNVRGGAIALGHPFGMTGARILTTMLNDLADTGGRYGLETMCVAGGQGMALIVENLRR